MTENAYVRPKSLYANILSIMAEIWVILCHEVWLLPSSVVWEPNVTQRVSCTHNILPRSRIKYVLCSFWNLAFCRILPCTLPLSLPTPLCFDFHCLWYNSTSWIAHNLNSFIAVEIHRPIASHWQTISQNVVSNTPLHVRDSNSQRQQWW